jgi:hypothetical protein
MSDCRRTYRGKADVSGPLCSHHLDHYVIFTGREIRLAFRVMPCNSTACHLTQRERIVLPGFCPDHGTRRRRAHDPKRIISRAVPWERFWSAQEAASNRPSSPARSTAARLPETPSFVEDRTQNGRGDHSTTGLGAILCRACFGIVKRDDVWAEATGIGVVTAS